MSVLIPLPVSSGQAPAAAPPRSPGLWQLGIEAQELTSQIARQAEQLDAEDEATRTEAIAALEAALLAEEGNRQALVAKADATCWVIEHLRAQATYRSQQARRLTELARSDAASAESLEQSLVLVLTPLEPGAVRFSFPHHELSSRRSQAVVIEDEEVLHPRWLVVKSTAQPDKVAIKETSWRIR